jgi:hypothetical protein
LKTANILQLLGEAYLQDEEFSSSIKHIENACLIINTLHLKREFSSQVLELSKTLDKLYLLLVDLYLQTQR